MLLNNFHPAPKFLSVFTELKAFAIKLSGFKIDI